MRVTILRLELITGKTYAVKDPWPSEVYVLGSDGKPVKLDLFIGAIYRVLRTRDGTSWIEEVEEDGQKRRTTFSDVKEQPALYELWAFPKEEQMDAMSQGGEIRRLTIEPQHVLFAEDSWPLDVGWAVVAARREESEVDEGDDDEGTDEPAAPVAVAS